MSPADSAMSIIDGLALDTTVAANQLREEFRTKPGLPEGWWFEGPVPVILETKTVTQPNGDTTISVTVKIDQTETLRRMWTTNPRDGRQVNMLGEYRGYSNPYPSQPA